MLNKCSRRMHLRIRAVLAALQILAIGFGYRCGLRRGNPIPNRSACLPLDWFRGSLVPYGFYQ